MSMFYVKKVLEIAGAHHLDLPYPSKCQGLHGHNWIVTIECKSPFLNDYGMLVDFTEIKNRVQDTFDHKNLNDVIKVNPTAENMARIICDLVPHCFRVTVKESSGNEAVYEREPTRTVTL